MSGILKRGLLCIALLWSCVVAAEVAIPSLSARVTDLTNTLSANQKVSLEQSLANFEAQKGAQIAVLMVPTTAPESIEQYSLRVVDAWKLGRKKIDDGALLIIAKDDRTLRIEVGYGLEGALNDAVSKRIISETIVPYFKKGDYYEGIEAGLQSMMKVISGEPLPAPQKSGGPVDQNYLPLIFIVVVALGGLFRALLGRLVGSVATGIATTVLAWIVIGVFSFALFAGVVALLITLLSGGARGIGPGHYGGGGFGRGGRRGGGGGFGGGGGGFGGGGASGRW